MKTNGRLFDGARHAVSRHCSLSPSLLPLLFSHARTSVSCVRVPLPLLFPSFPSFIDCITNRRSFAIRIHSHSRSHSQLFCVLPSCRLHSHFMTSPRSRVEKHNECDRESEYEMVEHTSGTSTSVHSLSLVTFNSYLFPHGMRHSRAYPDKHNRAQQILRHMKRHTCDERCGKELENGTSAPVGGKKQSNVPSSAPAKPSSSSPCPNTPLLAADICCFQEVLGSLWCSQWKKFFTHHLMKPRGVAPIISTSATSSGPSSSPRSSTMGEYELVFSPPPSLCRGVIVDSGLMIASRYPVLYSTFRTFNNNPFLMKMVDKGFQHAVIDVTDSSAVTSSGRPSKRKVLHVINTHLHPHEASYSVAHGQGVRRLQVQQIREHLLSTQDDTTLPEHCRFDPRTSALIVTGDLNTEQGSDQCAAIREILDCTSYSAIDGQEPTMHSAHPFCNHPPEQTICGDYAIGNVGVKMGNGVIVKDAAHLSDHYPVRVQFDVL